MPDHPTPCGTQAHSAEPVPFAMAGAEITGILNTSFSEANAAKSGFRIDNGFELMEYFLKYRYWKKQQQSEVLTKRHS